MFENGIHIDFMDDNKMGGSKQKFYFLYLFSSVFLLLPFLISTFNTDMSVDAVHITDITRY